MLVEIRCDKFRTALVTFTSGLNAILGDANGSNSIGKSTMLMVIDFAFGGDSLTRHNTDLVRELGHHEYYFTFRFANEYQRFKRTTQSPDSVELCDEAFAMRKIVSAEDYAARLMVAYGIKISDITFRALVGLHFRVWGKQNLLVKNPLHPHPQTKAQVCVDNLLKTFEKYDGIRVLAERVKTLEEERKARRGASKYSLVSKTTRTGYQEKQREVESLSLELDQIRENLASYAINIAAVLNEETLALKLRKDELLRTKLSISGRLQRVEANLDRTRSVRSKHFDELLEYFPSANRDRLKEVEEFHNGVAQILQQELRDSKKELVLELSNVDEALAEIDKQMAKTLNSVEKPEALVDRVCRVAISLHDASKYKETYEHEKNLDDSVKEVSNELSIEKKRVLLEVEKSVNEGMATIVANLIGKDRKSPTLSLSDGNYAFEIYDDTGTGTAYAGLILFDLAVFLATQVPAIAHDSVLFKNIENDSVAKLINTYMATTKQSFISLDEVDKYGPEAAALLRSRACISLSDTELLYIKDWRSENRSIRSEEHNASADEGST